MLRGKILSLSNLYFRKKKLNYYNGFKPGDFQVICGSLVCQNRRLKASTGTPVRGHDTLINFHIFSYGCAAVVKFGQQVQL